MTLIYRLLSLFINFFSFLLVFSLLFMFPVALANPAMLLPVFVMVAVVLYSLFSSRFRQKVLVSRQQVNHSLRDWVRVNGIVALVFCFIDIPYVVTLIRNPAFILNTMKELMKQYPQKMQQEIPVSSITLLGYVMLSYFIGLLIHVLWTFALLKKNESYFEK